MYKPFDSIKDLSIEEAEKLVVATGEKEYKAKQIFNWLYERNIDDYDLMTDISKRFRLFLKGNYPISSLLPEERLISSVDGAEKYLFKTADGQYVESVLIRNDQTDEGRLTVCVSSQVGCAMGCVFCQTGRMGFVRNLSPGEIIDQVCHIRRITGLKNNNVVFMGMGEPFNNYDNVIKAADIMNYSFGFHLSTRKITISTCGITPALERYIDEKRMYNLAISLNDTLSEKRAMHMPVERIYPFESIRDLLESKYPHSKNRVTIGYVMRNDNISSGDAKRLKRMFRYSRIKLNLIHLNRGSHGLELPSPDEITHFIEELKIMNVPISIRNSLGTDIYGACGQLSGNRVKEAS